jgi:integral membrane sensor domain MASE1
MLEKIRSQTDLLLLLSVVLVIVIYPLLDHDDLRRLILAALIFVPLLLATIRLSKKRGWVWPSVLLMLASFIVAAASTVFPIKTLVGMKWGLLTVFFGFTVFGLFFYLKRCPLGHQCAPLYCNQHLPFAWNAVDPTPENWTI